jgi:hypothetical protein
MRPCSEFPNDNPAFHRGAIWRCEQLTGPAICVLPEGATRAPEACDEAAPPPPPEAETVEDPFRLFVGLLEDVARRSGATEPMVASVRALLGIQRMNEAEPPEASVEALMQGMQVERTPRGIERTEAFARRVLAWQGILRAESEDFEACGPTPLDEWAADIVARVLASPAAAAGLRRELRRGGVAAFGLVAQAA